MVQRSEAVFEHGILRPLEPLPLEERQHVLLTITDLPQSRKAIERNSEQEWLRLHSEEYAGQWVALDGNSLLSHGSDARTVRDQARATGIELPMLVHIPEETGLPSAGWL